ncbi:MAG: UDP-3-O-(3-hydroxymyristoyl)glucosamine N-acyltransferase [Gammaproteobacteria bacterium]
MFYTLQYLADMVGGEVSGDPEVAVSSVATLDKAHTGQISFLINSKYTSALASTQASAVILPADCRGQCPTNAIVVANAHAAYALIASLLHPPEPAASGIHPSAVIEADASIAADAWIGPNTYIGHKARIGRGVQVHAGTVIERDVSIGEASVVLANVTLCRESQLGERLLIHPGVVIGADGFGQANDQGTWRKIPQIGRVIIGNDVEIGANTTIDRGSIGDTVIGDGVKLDNLIQIAHNVEIGAHTVIASSTAIAGSTKIGRHCIIAGAVGIVGHIEITDNVTLLGMSMVSKSITEAGVYGGSIPAIESRKWAKQLANMRHIGDILKRLRALEKKN